MEPQSNASRKLTHSELEVQIYLETFWHTFGRSCGCASSLAGPNVLASRIALRVQARPGTLAEHFALLFEDRLSESVCADRRARTPWQMFAELMARALRPLATRVRQPVSGWPRMLTTKSVEGPLQFTLL